MLIYIVNFPAGDLQSAMFPFPELFCLEGRDLRGLGSTVKEMGYCTFLSAWSTCLCSPKIYMLES